MAITRARRDAGVAARDSFCELSLLSPCRAVLAGSDLGFGAGCGWLPGAPLIDNLLYPVLIGKDLRMHTVPVFIAIVGGLVVFGASGLVLGPLVLATTLVLLDIWRWRTAGGRLYSEELPPRKLANTTKAG